jgi:hypothetical protein
MIESESSAVLISLVIFRVFVSKTNTFPSSPSVMNPFPLAIAIP